ncbi:MAG: GGDEF domain-containing protein [Lachnospiraceae bacterium]|nr:GGDEF domain-containing protein [Lachnospiraceae bacterium]
MFENIIYYGHSKETYNEVKSQRDYFNRKMAEIVTTLFLVMMLVMSSLAMIGILPRAHRFIYINYFAATLALALILFLLGRFVSKHVTLFMYLSYLLLISFSIVSSQKDSFQTGVVYPPLILMLSILFIDNMIRYSIISVIGFVCFYVVSYYTKPPSIAQNDLFYGLLFLIIALILHFRFHRNRLEQFVNYHKIEEIQRDLIVQSSFDVLSGLLARGRFFSLAATILHERTDDEFVALCILDLDSFKQINDIFGHQMGDKAIQTAAQLIWECLGVDYQEKWTFCERAATQPISFAGRLGGDEFIIFFRNPNGMDAVKQSLSEILDRLNSVELGELNGICASFGVTQIRKEDTDIDTVYARADAALYNAKTSGKNRIVVSE